MVSLDLTICWDDVTWGKNSRTFDSTFTLPKVEKKHLMKLEWLISLNSVLLLEATPRSCLTSSSAVGQGHLYISTESDRSRINLEGSILRFPTICLTSIYLTIVSLPWDLQFLQRSPFMSFYLPISHPFEGHILEHYYFQQKKNNDIADLDMMMSFRHWTVVRSRLFLDTFDVSRHRFKNSSKDLHEWYILQHQRGLSRIHMSYSASEIAHRISRMGCQSPPGLLHF